MINEVMNIALEQLLDEITSKGLVDCYVVELLSGSPRVTGWMSRVELCTRDTHPVDIVCGVM